MSKSLEDEVKTMREALTNARNLLLSVPFDREHIIWATSVCGQINDALSEYDASNAEPVPIVHVFGSAAPKEQ